jgi:F0F1-type ATP synthase delta subunit
MARATLPDRYAHALFSLTQGISRNQAEGVIARFVTYLKSEGKLHLAGSVVKRFTQLLDEQQTREQVQVAVAHELSPRARAELLQVLQGFFKTENVGLHVDPSLVGGAVITHGYTRIDASVAGMLSRIS